MKDAVATMGGLLPDDAGGRDAVHVAVISAVAGEKLSPGQDIGFSGQVSQTGEGLASAAAPKLIGIVDPFLKGLVWPDQRFWLYIYPRKITGLNHQWSHPDLPDVGAKVGGDLYSTPAQRLASSRWIGDWAAGYGMTGSAMIEAATNFIKGGDYLCDGGKFEGERVPYEFWEHYERVTGATVPSAGKDNFFTCSC